MLQWWWRTRSERIEADIEDGQIYKQHNLPQTLTATEMFPCSPSCLSLGNSTKQQNVKIKNRKECRKVQRLGKNALVSLGVRERYISRVRLAARKMAISFGWTCVRITRTQSPAPAVHAKSRRTICVARIRAGYYIFRILRVLLLSQDSSRLEKKMRSGNISVAIRNTVVVAKETNK